jgi:plastocyanin
MKRSILSFAAVLALAGGLVAAGLAAAPNSASVLIRHQVRGCHSWSVNGGAFKASQSLTIRRGGSIVFTNNDVMPHQLIKTSGPAVKMVNLKTNMMGMGMHGPTSPGVMAHMGASTKVTFAKAGVYKLVTKAGEDYAPGMKTIGEDNVLRLTVTVS